MNAPRERKIATLGILIGIFLGALDATIVGTSMPTIVARLGGISIYFLVFSVFLVANVVSVPIFGRLSDLYGRRRLHLLGVAIFIGSSMLCGLSRSMFQLILFRGLQGIGAGCLVALSFTMIGDLYPLQQRAKMQGAISGIWGIASLAGPLAGGFITQHWGWPWVFYVNAPFGVVAGVLVQSAWRDVRGPERRKLDLPGAVLLTLAAGAFLSALTLVGRGFGWTSPWPLGLFGATILLVALLTFVERRADSPFLAYDLYRIRLFATGALTGCCAITCLFATTSYMPLFVQGVVGGSPTRAGMILIPMMLTWVLGSGISGFALLRLGYKKLALAGMVSVTVGYVLLTRLDADATWMRTALPLLFVGIGLGFTIPPLLIAAQNAVPKEKLGAATSLTQFTRTLGGALGVALMGTLLSATLTSRRPNVAGVPSPDAIVDPLTRRNLPEAVRDLWRLPLAAGLHRVFVVGAIAGGLGILLALSIPKGRAQDHVAQGDAGKPTEAKTGT